MEVATVRPQANNKQTDNHPTRLTEPKPAVGKWVEMYLRKLKNKLMEAVYLLMVIKVKAERFGTMKNVKAKAKS
uniref:Uncharacterized protein n=1 Tax=Romanomermis culicivorax TaxID=13658 RepID=A0A915IG13_ROMCU